MANDGSRSNEQQSSSAPTFLLFHKTNSPSSGTNADSATIYVPSSSAGQGGTTSLAANLAAGTSGTQPGTSSGHHPDSESDDSEFTQFYSLGLLCMICAKFFILFKKLQT
jgi:hypothetical protein